LGQGRRTQPDARPQLADVDPAQPFAEQERHTRGRVCRGRRGNAPVAIVLPAPLGPMITPAFVELDRPIQRTDQDTTVAAQRNASEVDQEIRVGSDGFGGVTRIGAGIRHPIIVPYRDAATAAGSPLPHPTPASRRRIDVKIADFVRFCVCSAPANRTGSRPVAPHRRRRRRPRSRRGSLPTETAPCPGRDDSTMRRPPHAARASH